MIHKRLVIFILLAPRRTRVTAALQCASPWCHFRPFFVFPEELLTFYSRLINNAHQRYLILLVVVFNSFEWRLPLTGSLSTQFIKKKKELICFRAFEQFTGAFQWNCANSIYNFDIIFIWDGCTHLDYFETKIELNICSLIIERRHVIHTWRKGLKVINQTFHRE